VNPTRANNTPRRAVVALAVALALAVGMTACGGGSQSVGSLLNETFHPNRQVHSFNLNLAFGVATSGLPKVSGPVSLQVQGPFESRGNGQLPRFDLGVDIGGSGRQLKVGATSTGEQFFVNVQGVPYVAPQSALAALQQGYSKSAAARGGQAPIATLGIDPSHWLVDPRIAGSATIGGAQTIHVSAGLDVPAFLGDIGRLGGTGSALGLGGLTQVGASLTPAQRSALARSVTSAHVDIYTGRDDHLLRRLSLTAAIAADAAASAALGGLHTGTINFLVQFAGLNQPQTIVAPANPHPLSELATALAQLGVVSGSQQASSSAAAPTTTTAPPTASPAPASPAYMQCVQQAGKDLAALQRCAPLLAQR
jgi:hypothetical protein